MIKVTPVGITSLTDSGSGQTLIVNSSGVLKKIVAGTNISFTDNGSSVTIDSTSDDITVVANFSALPSPATATGEFYWANASQGTAWLPGALGGTYYSAGLYYSNGVSWEFLSVPYQALQATVDAGVVTNQFVTPATFTNASKWNTKEDSLTFSTGLTRSVNTITNDVLTGISGGQTWVGGTDAGDGIILKGTSGNGTTSVSALTVNVGNNGGTTAMQIFNSGNVNIGNAANTNAGILRIGAGTAVIDIGNLSATPQNAFIHMNQSTPGSTNYAIVGTSTTTALNATTSLTCRIGGTIKYTVTANSHSWITAGAASVTTQYTFSGVAVNAQTASTETIGVNFDFAQNIQHATGALTTNRDFLIQARTHAFVAASTITNAATFAITGAPTAGTNATITNPYALWIQSGTAGFDGLIKVNSGISVNGGGLKHSRVTTGSISGGSTSLVTVTWTTAFADANYTVSASVLDSTTTSLSLSVVHVESISSSAVTVRILNNSVGALTGTLHLIAIHD